MRIILWYVCCPVIAPVVEFISCDLGAEIGSDVLLNCTGSSPDGGVTVTWSTAIPNITLPEPTLTAEDDMIITSTIILDAVVDAYSGLYVCTVENRLGQATDNVTVAVISEFLATLYSRPKILG